MNLESPPIKKGLLSLSQFHIKVLRIRMMSMKIKIDENEMLNWLWIKLCIVSFFKHFKNQINDYFQNVFFPILEPLDFVHSQSI